jgi:hypothetical protein
MIDIINMLWTGVDKFHHFLLSPEGTKLLNIAFISSILFLSLLSVAFLLRQEFLVILSLVLSAIAGGLIYLLSIYSTPLPDQYGIIDKFLIITGAKHVSDPDMHITAGTGENSEAAFFSAIDSAFTTALGARTDGLFKNLVSKDSKRFEQRFRAFFKITKEKNVGDKKIIEVKWTLPAVRTFIIRNGFSPAPASLALEILKNPTSVPSMTLIDQIFVLYKAKSMYFKNGVFYATCDAIIEELKKTIFKTSAGEITIDELSYEEKTDAEGNRICSVSVKSIKGNQGG